MKAFGYTLYNFYKATPNKIGCYERVCISSCSTCCYLINKQTKPYYNDEEDFCLIIALRHKFERNHFVNFDLEEDMDCAELIFKECGKKILIQEEFDV